MFEKQKRERANKTVKREEESGKEVKGAEGNLGEQ